MIQKKKYFYFLFLGFICPNLLNAEIKEISIYPNELKSVISEIREPFSFSGLASFYNGLVSYVVDESKIERLDSETAYDLTSEEYLAIVGHQKILLLSNFDASILFVNNELFWEYDFGKKPFKGQILLKSDLNSLAIPFQQLKYAHLWAPLRLLCVGIEKILIWLQSVHNFGWGITIILFSVLFKIFILPANILLMHLQRKVSHIQASLVPDLEAIKEKFSGEEAHEKYLAAHRAQGVTPFYTLKPLLLTLLPVPFLVAIFNVLGELDLLAGHSFLWIKDLAYPDAVFDLGWSVPLLGNSVNLLPLIMTILTIFSAIIHENKIIAKKTLRKQKLNLYFMAFGFLLLFYPFPSAMVLYWTFANLWQIIQQRLIQL